MALVALLLTAGSFSACATGKPSGANRAGGIASFMIQPAGTELRIVSDAWIAGAGYEGETAMERRADFRRKTVYSASGTSAAVKACEDEVFQGLIEAFEAEGFGRYSVEGAARPEPAVSSYALEVTRDGDARHWLRVKGTPVDEAAAFKRCVAIFNEVFNVLDGYQSGDESFRFKE
ncbi:MAG: hypothetical protein R3F49_03660 [Planctomycetota bacterium]